jgi:hypothetical protein
MGRTVETAAVETKSSLPLLTTYRPLRFTWPVRPGSLSGPGVARGMKKIGFLLMSSGRQDESMATDGLTLEPSVDPNDLGIPGRRLRPSKAELSFVGHLRGWPVCLCHS